MTVKLILALVVGFGVSVCVGVFLVPWLRSIKAGQSIKEIGPVWHMNKSGTPTMGGIMFIAAVATVCFSVGLSCIRDGEWAHVFVLIFGLAFGVIGFLDDYEKLRHHENTGLSARMKFLLQLAAALIFLMLLRSRGYLSPNLYVPFWNTYCDTPFREAFGDHCVSFREVAISTGLAYEGITPTAKDEEYISNGEVPPSLLYYPNNPDVHLNAKGYDLLAHILYEQGGAIGIW